MIPETSGFFGRLEDRNAAEQEMFFHLQLHSLTKGPHSIKAKLDEYNAHFAQLNKQDKNEDIKIKVSFCTVCNIRDVKEIWHPIKITLFATISDQNYYS